MGWSLACAAAEGEPDHDSVVYAGAGYGCCCCYVGKGMEVWSCVFEEKTKIGEVVSTSYRILVLE